MAGSAVDGQLNVSAEGREVRGVRYALATPDDDAAIRRLLRDNPMRGAISLSFEREPNYFHGTQIAGAEDRRKDLLSSSDNINRGDLIERSAIPH